MLRPNREEIFFCCPQEDVTNTYDVFITVVFVFGVIGIFGAGTIRYRMGFIGNVSIFRVSSRYCLLISFAHTHTRKMENVERERKSMSSVGVAYQRLWRR